MLILRQAGWSLQRTVVLTGQVKAPGRYSLHSKTERLADLLQRAGGLTDEAYAGGIQFYRGFVGNQPSGTDQLPRCSRPPPARQRDSAKTRRRA